MTRDRRRIIGVGGSEMILRSVKLFTLLALLGAANAGASATPVKWPNFPADSTCTPAIPNNGLRLGTQATPAVSAQMKAIFDADQEDRQGNIDWAKVKPRDLAREKIVLDLLKTGKLVTGKELVGAAYVFQHGSCPNHFLLANVLAERAIKLGTQGAKWIYAATLDRWLLNTRKPQKFGGEPPAFVQVRDKSGKIMQCIFIQLPMDSTTTDADLKKYDQLSLSEIKKRNDGIIKESKAICKGVPINPQKFY